VEGGPTILPGESVIGREGVGRCPALKMAVMLLGAAVPS